MPPRPRLDLGVCHEVISRVTDFTLIRAEFAVGALFFHRRFDLPFCCTPGFCHRELLFDRSMMANGGQRCRDGPAWRTTTEHSTWLQGFPLSRWGMAQRWTRFDEDERPVAWIHESGKPRDAVLARQSNRRDGTGVGGCFARRRRRARGARCPNRCPVRIHHATRVVEGGDF